MKQQSRKAVLTGNSKKGAATILDVTFFMIVIVVVGLTGLGAYYVINAVNTDIQSDSDMSADAKAELQQATNNAPNVFDGIFVFFVVGLWIAAIALSYFVDASPLLYGLIFIIGVALVFVGIVISEWATDVQNDAEFISLSADLPLTFMVLTKMPLYIIVVFGSALISLFAKEARQ